MSARGFSLLEVMIALSVLLVGAAGALMAVYLHSSGAPKESNVSFCRKGLGRLWLWLRPAGNSPSQSNVVLDGAATPKRRCLLARLPAASKRSRHCAPAPPPAPRPDCAPPHRLRPAQSAPRQGDGPPRATRRG